MAAVTLDTGTLQAEFSRETGALTGLRAQDWEILSRPHLGLAFQLMLPLPDRRNNPVLSGKQTLTSVEAAEQSLTFTWGHVTSEHGGDHQVSVQAVVRVVGQALVFHLSIANHSPLVVENVVYPYLGDLQRPPGAAWFKAFLAAYATADEWSLWPTYDNHRGYYGVDHPIQYSAYDGGILPLAPFILLRSEQRGLYAGAERPAAEAMAWHTELRPGYGSSIDFRVPTAADVEGREVATRFGPVHVPFIQPGETRELMPIRLEAFEGDWQRGVDIYKRWRGASGLRQPSTPAWASEPHAWQQIHLNSPEDELRIPYRDLPSYGEDCARHGVGVLELTGWTLGGQDRDNPSHDTDPRLGTFAELKDAIAQIQTMGVKVILFTKYTWADRAAEAFRREHIRHAIKDPYGDYYVYEGYRYQTATQLLNINTRRLIPMCFLSEDYLSLAEAEFQKALDLGADGILFDESFHHNPALVCFDESHGHRPGAPVYANDRELIDRLRAMSGPSFLFAGEACYDWEMEVYSLSYHRSESKQHIPLSRYMLPGALFMTAVTGFNDRSMINQCLLYRYIICYEPFNFKGRLGDFPLTLAYGKQMDALRRELRAFFWDGEFRGTVGANVTRGDEAHHPYAVYVNRETGEAGLVIANYDETETINVRAALDDGGPLTRCRLVDEPTWQPITDGIAIPPQSAVVVLP